MPSASNRVIRQRLSVASPQSEATDAAAQNQIRGVLTAARCEVAGDRTCDRSCAFTP